MAITKRIAVYARKVKESTHLELQPDEDRHEYVNSWSNRDLIPLPPSRRTWGATNYFGFWTLASLNIANWQSPNTFLTEGMSVAQAMGVLIVAYALILFFSIIIARCGLRWHIGFTLQNRFTWGMRGSYIPLLQRILLNFIWTAVQCWNGGRLAAICLTALWPSYNDIPNSFGPDMPTTTAEFTGFIVFWFLSLPLIFIKPENFKRVFQFTSTYCGLAMFSMMVWSLSVAKGVGPIFTAGQTLPSGGWLNISWLMMSGINQTLGSLAAGMTNGSDFSRYAKNAKSYYLGSFFSVWIIGILVSFVGLVTTAATQQIYGKVYWNPPDLLMVMMDNGNGSSGARCGVFFLALGFALSSMFQNICGNVVAGGIDLAGLWPRYINLRRGALITFIACWIVQPWQLINRALTFILVLSSFSVFLAPIMGVMTADYYILRRQKIKLTDLYIPHQGSYWYWHGFNLRVIVPWFVGWAPTIVGLISSVNPTIVVPKEMKQLYFIAFFYGFFASAALFIGINKVWPLAGLSTVDATDVFGAFTKEELLKLSIEPLNEDISVIKDLSDSVENPENATVISKEMEVQI